MNSDSESQDSDDGRRFRFETTRKDAASLQQKRTSSPQRNRRTERRSRSRDRSSRDERSKHSSSDSSRRKRTPDRGDSNGRNSHKKKSKKSDKDDKDSNSRKGDRDSSRSHHHSKNHESKDARNPSDESKDSRDGKDHSSARHKNKSREKHKKRSRDRSRERNDLVSDHKESMKKEYCKATSNDSSTSVEAQDVEVKKRKMSKKIDRKDKEKYEDKMTSKMNDLKTSDLAVFSDTRVSKTSEMNETASTRKVSKSFFDRVVNKKSREEDDSMYGPALPPKLEKSLIIARESKKESFDDIEGTTPPRPITNCDGDVIGPALPEELKTGIQKSDDSSNGKEKIHDPSMSPRTPPRVEKIEVAGDESNEDEDDAFGPVLPPQLQRNKIVGPVLPENFVVPTSIGDELEDVEPHKDSDKSDEEDNSFGPLPADHPATQNSYVQMQLEQRAKRVKEKFGMKESPEKNKREEWMTELPPAHAVALGLGSIPRKFKTKEGPDMSDRSIWTDTPADRLRKQKEKEENRFIPSEDSSIKATIESEPVDQEVEEKKAESLLDMHLKTMKRKKKKEEKEAKKLGISTRRPFDRDVDLQTNRLDEARKKKIFEKASRLNDRFAVGKI